MKTEQEDLESNMPKDKSLLKRTEMGTTLNVQLLLELRADIPTCLGGEVKDRVDAILHKAFVLRLAGGKAQDIGDTLGEVIHRNSAHTRAHTHRHTGKIGMHALSKPYTTKPESSSAVVGTVPFFLLSLRGGQT